MPKSNMVRVRHMLDAAREAESLMAGKTRTEMEANLMLVLACTRLLEIIGEAASQVSPEFRAKHQRYPAPKS